MVASKNVKLLLFVFTFTLLFSMAELLAGVASKSLLLMEESVHMFADSVSFGISLWAETRSEKNNSLLANLIGSGISLLTLAFTMVAVFVESLRRLSHIHSHGIVVNSDIMLVFGLVLCTFHLGCLSMYYIGYSVHSHGHGSHVRDSGDVEVADEKRTRRAKELVDDERETCEIQLHTLRLVDHTDSEGHVEENPQGDYSIVLGEKEEDVSSHCSESEQLRHRRHSSCCHEHHDHSMEDGSCASSSPSSHSRAHHHSPLGHHASDSPHGHSHSHHSSESSHAHSHNNASSHDCAHSSHGHSHSHASTHHCLESSHGHSHSHASTHHCLESSHAHSHKNASSHDCADSSHGHSHSHASTHQCLESSHAHSHKNALSHDCADSSHGHSHSHGFTHCEDGSDVKGSCEGHGHSHGCCGVDHTSLNMASAVFHIFIDFLHSFFVVVTALVLRSLGPESTVSGTIDAFASIFLACVIGGGVLVLGKEFLQQLRFYCSGEGYATFEPV